MVEQTDKKQEATLRDFLNVLFRRKHLIVSIVLLTTLSIFYVSASQPQTYVSSSRILVKRGERSDVFASRPMLLTWREEVSSQIEVILSEAVFNRARQLFADSAAVRNVPHLAFNPGAVRADVVGESNVFRIAYGGIDPVECLIGCQAVTEAFRQYYRERTAPPEVADYFTTEITDALEQLDYWRQKRSEFLRTYRFSDVDDESRRHSVKLERLEIRLAEVTSDLSSQSLRLQRLARLKMLSPAKLEDNLAVGGQRNDLQTTIMRDVKASLQRIRLEREGLLQKYTPRHPDVVALDGQIRDLQLNLAQEVGNAWEVEKALYDELKAKEASLEAEVTATRTAIKKIPGQQVELSRLDNKIEAFQTRYETLLDRQAAAEIARASTPEWEITVLSPPGRAWPSKTRDYVRLAVGPFLSLIVAFGVAFFFESLDHSLKNASEVEQYLGRTVLATFGETRRR